MPLTKVQTIGIETGISLTGVTTVTTLNASTDTLSVGGTVNFGGNVSIAGTLTYEDVTNIDAVGIITARSGIEIGSDNQKIIFGIIVMICRFIMMVQNLIFKIRNRIVKGY